MRTVLIIIGSIFATVLALILAVVLAAFCFKSFAESLVVDLPFDFISEAVRRWHNLPPRKPIIDPDRPRWWKHPKQENENEESDTRLAIGPGVHYAVLRGLRVDGPTNPWARLVCPRSPPLERSTPPRLAPCYH